MMKDGAGGGLVKNERGTMMTKNYIVKEFAGYKNGWQEIKRFNNPAQADEWLMNYIRRNKYIVSDFTIMAR